MVEEECTAPLVYKYVLEVGEDRGTALLVYKYVLGVGEDRVSLSLYTNEH